MLTAEMCATATGDGATVGRSADITRVSFIDWMGGKRCRTETIDPSTGIKITPHLPFTTTRIIYYADINQTLISDRVCGGRAAA